ncbi:glycosyltransferase family 4 protein [Corynebacterium sp. YSMAA1_1_F7]|uniref:glycosyltransferase family 4 protein n=1 Tax=Corynebacterium sp. YSMAA1_1_F7 TaxID=3383590 RepID=UPI0025D74D78|nr:glycosyltransferase family 4 protein [uncultured Corynebacterium sp.]
MSNEDYHRQQREQSQQAPQSHPRVLVVTNDFPPTFGGIQTYVRDYLSTLDPDSVVVFASTQHNEDARAFDDKQAYRVIRWPRSVMLPTPATARKMQQLIREHDIHTVWFGAAAPLALMATAARAAGARRVVASTHGHEVGWSMFPGSRQVLGKIGRSVDCLTYVSHYARNRMAAAFGPTVAWEPMPGGVNIDLFRPDPAMRQDLRARYRLEGKKVIVAVSRLVPRKGQDTLVKAMPAILRKHPDAHLLIVGPGTYRVKLEKLARRLGVAKNTTFTGAVEVEELPGHFVVGDVFALPVRTQFGGLSVEGLGIVFLEAQATGVATVSGNGGGAPETVIDGETGLVVDSRNLDDVAGRISSLLGDAPTRQRLATAARQNVTEKWTWEVLGYQCRAVMTGGGEIPPRHSFA